MNVGDTLLSRSAIPFIRSRNVAFRADLLKAHTKMYAFFDSQKVDQYILPRLIELIKDPNVNADTNSVPFTTGETVTGLLSGVIMQVSHLMPTVIHKTPTIEQHFHFIFI